MKAVRSAIFWALMALALVVMGLPYLFLSLFDPGGARFYFITVRFTQVCAWIIGVRYRVSGHEYIPQSGSYVIMPNHRSYWDIPAIYGIPFPHRIRFVAKQELARIPVFGWCMKQVGHILIDRSDRESAIRTMNEMARKLGGVSSVAVFPEGTRSPGLEMLRFRKGGFHLARELKLPIVPVSISHSQKIMEKGSLNLNVGREVAVRFHPPIDPTGFAKLGEMIDVVRKVIESGLEDLPAKDPTASSPKAGDGPGNSTSTARLLPLVLAASLTLGGTTALAGDAPVFPFEVSNIESALQRIDPPVVPADLVVDQEGRRLYGDGPYRLSLHEATTVAPFRAPQFGGLIAGEAVAAVNRPYRMFSAAAARQDHSVRRGLLGDPSEDWWRLAGEKEGLYRALSSLYTKGKRLTGAKGDGVRREAAVLPATLARVTASLVHAAVAAAEWQRLAFQAGPMESGFLGSDRFEADVITFVDSLDSQAPRPVRMRLETAAASVDFDFLNAGASELALALERAVAVMDTVEPGGDFQFEWATPAGRVAVGGGAANEYRGDFFLIVDSGGDDRYFGAGSVRSLDRPVSIIVDRAGNDHYAPADSAGPGVAGAVGGYAFVADMAGDDEYVSWRTGIGAAAFGVGLLWDRSGNDRYRSHAFGQGAGLFGIGIVADATGDDAYTLLQAGQGFGGPLGVGWLIDADGDDVYAALDDWLVFPSSQAPEHNTSLAQGCGWGVRADYLDGHSLAGGFGLLADGAGDDRYRASVFGQGAAYWYGVGVLADFAGADRYDGVWYAQGAAAHYAVGLLLDAAGDDTLTATRNMAQGAGHDLSLGALVDAAGDDAYTAPNLGLGAGNANGIGLFIDASGNDTYRTPADVIAIGAASPGGVSGLRQAIRTFGLFMDLGGRDRYPAGGEAAPRNDASWGRRIDSATRGAGLDSAPENTAASPD